MEFVQNNWMWIVAAVVSGGMLVWPVIRGAGGGGSGVTATQATLMMNRDDAVVLDVREPAEYSRGHIVNARHIALGQLEKRLSEIEKFKERPVIVCCATGSRSGSALSVLRKAGFSKVYNLSGGMGAWEQAGLPTTKK